MKAMILAAGLGTRLKPLTDKVPKALVEIDGTPMLQLVIESLMSQGFNEIIVNVHHFAGMIKDFLNHHDFGADISVSDESYKLLDTGGGIVNALPLLFMNNDLPVLVHNVDILSNADLRRLYNNAKDSNDAACLLINDRDSSRKLVFDKSMHLKGWHNLSTNEYRPAGMKMEKEYKEYSFSGIYCMTRSGVEEMKEAMGEGKYSVMDYFLSPDRKMDIQGIYGSDLKLLDIGKPATLSQASGLLNEIRYQKFN